MCVCMLMRISVSTPENQLLLDTCFEGATREIFSF